MNLLRQKTVQKTSQMIPHSLLSVLKCIDKGMLTIKIIYMIKYFVKYIIQKTSYDHFAFEMESVPSSSRIVKTTLRSKTTKVTQEEERESTEVSQIPIVLLIDHPAIISYFVNTYSLAFVNLECDT